MHNKHFLYQTSFLLAGVIAMASTVLAQNNDTYPKLEHRVDIGFVQHNITDSLVAAGKVPGDAINFNYSISRTGTKRKTILSAAYQAGNYTTANKKIQQRGFDISLSDGFNVVNANKKLGAYLGYALSSSYSYTLPNSMLGNNFSWSSYNAISFYQSYTYAWPQQSLALDISIPVAGIVYRTRQDVSNTANKGSFKEMIGSVFSNPSFAALHNNMLLNAQLSYRKKMSDRIDLSCKYNFIYRNWTGEQPLLSISNTVAIGAVYKVFK